MAQPTQNFKRSLSGSIGSGMKSIFQGDGRRYYVLEHKVSSKYHQAGESQRIIVDEIELGRDAKCQVRFDESFTTVSRRHAAIVKDGNGWKLVQLSQTNSTYLNGRKVQKEWYLQSGDEIQLSTNGPKIGFIVPAGDKGLVKSIGMTARLNLFRQQALRPYKQAITALGILLLLGTGIGGYISYSQHEKIHYLTLENHRIEESTRQKLAEAEEQRRRDQEENTRVLEQQKQEFAEQIRKEQERTNRAIREAENKIRQQGGQTQGIAAIAEQQGVAKDVYFLQTEKVVYVQDGRETLLEKFGWSGTGFLLSDGRFVTARHCVEGWLYEHPMDEQFIESFPQVVNAIINAAAGQGTLKAYFVAVNMDNEVFEFTSDDFKKDHSKDVRAQIAVDSDTGDPIYWIFPFPAMKEWPLDMWATDWAYTTLTKGKRGAIQADAAYCKQLIPMQQMFVYGFPKGLGVMDGKMTVEPITNVLTVSRKGLAKNGCIMHGAGTDHGNSGGPIFALKDDKLVVVGIVSRGDGSSEQYNWAVPISRIY